MVSNFGMVSTFRKVVNFGMATLALVALVIVEWFANLGGGFLNFANFNVQTICSDVQILDTNDSN